MPATRYSLEMHGALIAELSKTGFMSIACRVCQLDESTVYKWLQLGKAGDARYHTLYIDYLRAKGEKETTLIQYVQNEPGGAKWLLTKANASLFGDKNSQSLMQELIDAVEPLMPPDAYGHLLNALAQLTGSGGLAPSEAAQDGGSAPIDAEGESVDAKVVHLLPEHSDSQAD